MEIKRGDRVLVRTYGNYPRVRRIWEIERGACVVVEDQWYADLERGDYSFAVSMPLEDVFYLTPGVSFDPRYPFEDWGSLRRVAL